MFLFRVRNVTYISFTHYLEWGSNSSTTGMFHWNIYTIIIGVFRYPELVSELLENKKLPSHNYLSWALNGASSDESLLPFVKEHKIKALKCK